MSAPPASPEAAAVARSLLTIADVARHLNVSTRTVRHEIVAGRLAVVSIGRRLLRVRAEALARYIAAQEVQCSKEATGDRLAAQIMDRLEHRSRPHRASEGHPTRGTRSRLRRA